MPAMLNRRLTAALLGSVEFTFTTALAITGRLNIVQNMSSHVQSSIF